MNRGWLAQNLPDEIIRSDQKLVQYVDQLEPTLTDIRAGIEVIPYYLDVSTAPPEFVEWVGSWLGIVVQLPVDDQAERERRLRNIVHVAGTRFSTRGTKSSLEALLAAVTGSTVTVEDNGGVYSGDTVVFEPIIVRVNIDSSGGLRASQLFELIERDMPVHVNFELRIAGRMVKNGVTDDRDALVIDTNSDELAIAADSANEDEVSEESVDSTVEKNGIGDGDSDPTESSVDRDDTASDEPDSVEDPEELD